MKQVTIKVHTPANLDATYGDLTRQLHVLGVDDKPTLKALAIIKHDNRDYVCEMIAILEWIGMIVWTKRIK